MAGNIPGTMRKKRAVRKERTALSIGNGPKLLGLNLSGGSLCTLGSSLSAFAAALLVLSAFAAALLILGALLAASSLDSCGLSLGSSGFRSLVAAAYHSGSGNDYDQRKDFLHCYKSLLNSAKICIRKNKSKVFLNFFNKHVFSCVMDACCGAVRRNIRNAEYCSGHSKRQQMSG